MGSDRQPRIADLSSPAARAALDEWARGPHFRRGRLGLAEFLRKRFDPPLARALAEQFELRQLAGPKFAFPERMLLHRKGLEQATRLEVARWRARRVKDFAPKSPIIDATCGLGADSLALIEAGLTVLCLEADEETSRFAAHNLLEVGGRNCVVLGSAQAAPVRGEYWLIDPDRRDEGPRSHQPERWSPPLSVALGIARGARGACIKLAPGFDGKQLTSEALGPGAWLATWVSAGGELRECCLWGGEWATHAAAGEREVVSLAADAARRAPATLRAVPETVEALDPAEAAQIRYLAEPDPALIRSGLLGNVARIVGARPLAAQIAYLGAQEPIEHPLLRAWPVRDSCALDPKRVRRMLAEHDVGTIEVRKRGHPDAAEVLAKRLAGPGKQHGMLAIARLARGHQAYLLGR